jgi:hypothetical protein
MERNYIVAYVTFEDLLITFRGKDSDFIVLYRYPITFFGD